MGSPLRLITGYRAPDGAEISSMGDYGSDMGLRFFEIVLENSA